MSKAKIFGKALLTVALVAGFTGGAASAAAADLWLHLKVDGGKDEQVEINMPLSMIESLAPMLQDKVKDGNRVRIDDRDYDLAELRRVWRQLEDGPDATYLTVNEPDSKVRIGKRGSHLVMTADERGGERNGERVEARIPISVMAALLSGPGDRLDLSAALRELGRLGEGELMTVTSEDEIVRIWIGEGDR